MIDLNKIREDLHRIPELAHEEYKTQAYVLERLSSYEKLEIKEFKPTGILVKYNGGTGSYLLFRADMDALNIEEKTGCGFESDHKGKMHACGHDMHMTILLGLIDRIIEEELPLNLLFLFQPAEEGKGGAEQVLADKVWEGLNIEAAYALHVSPELAVGKIGSRAGNFFAATTEFDIDIKGRSSHIAMPEEGRSALEAGVEIYQCVKQLPEIVKSSERFICDFGIMCSGKVRNAVPAECMMSGTIRAEDLEKVRILRESLLSICYTVGTAYEVEVHPRFLVEYREVFNDKELLADLKSAAQRCEVEYVGMDRTMTGEDFGYIAGRWPGILFWLGAAEEEFHPLHNDKFLGNCKALKPGIKIFRELIKIRKGI